MPRESAKLRREVTLRQLWESSTYYRPSPDRSNPLNLRLRRSLSWVARAEHEGDDCDAAFVFYWIAFNAAYGRTGNSPSGNQDTERRLRQDYFQKVVACDADTVHGAIWPDLVPRITMLMNNKYVFEPFWKHHNEEPGHQGWEDKYKASKRRVMRALGNQETTLILEELFASLYTLRNQLLHGGATWRGSVNRDQVRTGAAIMAVLVPCMIEVMIMHPEADWGVPRYPPVA